MSVCEPPAVTPAPYLYLCDVTPETPYRLVSTSFPDSSQRAGAYLADEVLRCSAVECGSLPRCLRCADSVTRCNVSDEPLLTPEQRFAASVRRSQRTIEDTVRASSLTHLLTLSAGKQLANRTHALDAWSGYLDDSRYGRWFNAVLGQSYVAVAEPYKDGRGWHIHVAIPGYLRPPHLQRLKVTWTAYLYSRWRIARPDTPKRLWRVQVEPPKPYHSPKSLGRYMAKYLGKDLAADYVPGERRFRCGHGCRRPVVTSQTVSLTPAGLDALLADARAAGATHIREVHAPDGRFIGYSWELPPPS